MRLALINFGQMGSAPAHWLAQKGHDVTIAARHSGSESVRMA